MQLNRLVMLAVVAVMAFALMGYLVTPPSYLPPYWP